MIDLQKYSEFVQAITSDASDNMDSFVYSLDRLNAGKPEVNISLLLTGAIGMCGEAGEFSEIVKKCLFHGKKLDEDVHAHLIKELGDVIFYWTNACRSLGIDPNDVVAANVSKLEARYPGGVFSADRSEKREDGDI